MNPRKPPIELWGQRSIPSLFSFGSSNRESRDSISNRKVSLSTFLDRKLQRSSEQHKTVQGKTKPFSFPTCAASVDDGVSNEGQIGERKGDQKDLSCALDRVVFEQLKQGRKEKVESESKNGLEEATTCGISQGIAKEMNPLRGGNGSQIARKHLVVLGDDPKPKRGFREDIFSSNKKPKLVYDHYANGPGWLDCDRGVDYEEVGCGEAWEGMGSITLGGLDWH